MVLIVDVCIWSTCIGPRESLDGYVSNHELRDLLMKADLSVEGTGDGFEDIFVSPGP